MGGQSIGASGGDAIDPMVQSLMEMGFKRGQCEKATLDFGKGLGPNPKPNPKPNPN